MATELINEEEWIVVPTFDGDNLQLWIKEIEEIMTQFQVPKVQFVNFAHVYVEGAARDWVRLNYDAVCEMNWQQFVDAIKAEFRQNLVISECVDEDGLIQGTTDKDDIKEPQRMDSVDYVVASRTSSIDITLLKGTNIANSDIGISGKLATNLYRMAVTVASYTSLVPNCSWEPGPDLLAHCVPATVQSFSNSYFKPYFDISSSTRTISDAIFSIGNEVRIWNRFFGVSIFVSGGMVLWKIAWGFGLAILRLQHVFKATSTRHFSGNHHCILKRHSCYTCYAELSLEQWELLGDYVPKQDVSIFLVVETSDFPPESAFVSAYFMSVIGKARDTGHKGIFSKNKSDCVVALSRALFYNGGLYGVLMLMKWLDIEVALATSIEATTRFLNRALIFIDVGEYASSALVLDDLFSIGTRIQSVMKGNRMITMFPGFIFCICFDSGIIRITWDYKHRTQLNIQRRNSSWVMSGFLQHHLILDNFFSCLALDFEVCVFLRDTNLSVLTSGCCLDKIERSLSKYERVWKWFSFRGGSSSSGVILWKVAWVALAHAITFAQSSPIDGRYGAHTKKAGLNIILSKGKICLYFHFTYGLGCSVSHRVTTTAYIGFGVRNSSCNDNKKHRLFSSYTTSKVILGENLPARLYSLNVFLLSPTVSDDEQVQKQPAIEMQGNYIKQDHLVMPSSPKSQELHATMSHHVNTYPFEITKMYFSSMAYNANTFWNYFTGGSLNLKKDKHCLESVSHRVDDVGTPWVVPSCFLRMWEWNNSSMCCHCIQRGNVDFLKVNNLECSVWVFGMIKGYNHSGFQERVSSLFHFLRTNLVTHNEIIMYTPNCLTLAASLQAYEETGLRLIFYNVANNSRAILTFYSLLALQGWPPPCNLQVVCVALFLILTLVDTNFSSSTSTKNYYNFEDRYKSSYNGMTLRNLFSQATSWCHLALLWVNIGVTLLVLMPKSGLQYIDGYARRNARAFVGCYAEVQACGSVHYIKSVSCISSFDRIRPSPSFRSALASLVYSISVEKVACRGGKHHPFAELVSISQVFFCNPLLLNGHVQGTLFIPTLEALFPHEEIPFRAVRLLTLWMHFCVRPQLQIVIFGVMSFSTSYILWTVYAIRFFLHSLLLRYLGQTQQTMLFKMVLLCNPLWIVCGSSMAYCVD